MISLIGSCSEEPNYKGNYDSQLNQLYSNKIYPQLNARDLELTYSGSALYGKDVYFEMATATTARISLLDILPTESRVLIESVPVTKTADGHAFSGTATSPKGTSFDYAGKIVDGTLSFELKEVKIPTNALTRKGTWKMKYASISDDPDGTGGTVYDTGFFLNWAIDGAQAPEASEFLVSMGGLLNLLLPNIMYLMLDELTFHEDGNITAVYAQGLDEDVMTATNVLMWMFGMHPTPDQRKELAESPRNLIKYFVDEETVYIIPDVEMIVRQIMADQTKATTYANQVAGSNDIIELLNNLLGSLLPGVTLNDLAPFYKTLNQWTTTGIPFTFQANSGQLNYYNIGGIPSIHYLYEGDFALYLKGEQLKTLVPILPAVTSLVGDIEVPMLGSLGDILGPLFSGAPATTRFELGIFFDQDL